MHKKGEERQNTQMKECKAVKTGSKSHTDHKSMGSPRMGRQRTVEKMCETTLEVAVFEWDFPCSGVIRRGSR